MRKEVKVVNSDAIRDVIPKGCTVDGFRVKRMITRAREGSEKIMLGMCTIMPRSKGYRWSFSENDEVYYVMAGSIRLHWDGGSVEATKGDAVFLPAGRDYQLDNVSNELAAIIYALVPPIE